MNQTSALATALTDELHCGIHLEKNRIPNILVKVEASMENLADWSVLGDWIGMQIKPEWNLPWGMMPRIVVLLLWILRA